MVSPNPLPGNASSAGKRSAGRISKLLAVAVACAIVIDLVVWTATPRPARPTTGALAPGHPTTLNVDNVTLKTLDATVSPCVTYSNGVVGGDIIFRFQYQITSAATSTVGVDVQLFVNGSVTTEHFYWIAPHQVINDTVGADVGVYNGGYDTSTSCPSPPSARLGLWVADNPA